jgi:hypothetical protein
VVVEPAFVTEKGNLVDCCHNKTCGEIKSKMIDIFLNTFSWIKDDWKSNKIRFVVEVVAWLISIGCSFVMAITVPNPPLLALYPVWITGCGMYAWAAYTRKSFGMLANYLLLVTIDSIGLLRMLG